jgi:hypothetical protein
MGAVVSEFDVKKDERNRITLKAAAYEYYHAKVFDDGHIEFYPQVLADASVSARTVEMMDRAMANFATGRVGSPMDAKAMLERLGDEDDQPA